MVETEVLAVVPARGGSKGLHRKNLHPFLGHPLIAFSIAAATQAETVSRVIVSTDDVEIASIAVKYGAEVPFMRPGELATDTTPDLPVFKHALDWLAVNEGYFPQVVVQLRPTSPLRPVNCVDDAVRMLLDHPEATSVRGVVPSAQNPHKMWRINEKSGQLAPLLQVEGIAEPYNSPRQALPKTYWQTGHIDVLRPSTIADFGSMSGPVILPLLMDDRYAVDIDDLFSLQHAEWVVHNSQLEMIVPGRLMRPMPEKVELVVFDFDGVMTDNRVWVDQLGNEMIAANRSDSQGIKELRQAGIRSLVLSTETNPVVAARCKKIDLPVIQGVGDKAAILMEYLQREGIDPRHVVYVGNDVNDLPCFPLVGWAVVVNDALPAASEQADYILTRRGGYAAVREVCEIILAGSRRA